MRQKTNDVPAHDRFQNRMALKRCRKREMLDYRPESRDK